MKLYLWQAYQLKCMSVHLRAHVLNCSLKMAKYSHLQWKQAVLIQWALNILNLLNTKVTHAAINIAHVLSHKMAVTQCIKNTNNMKHWKAHLHIQ